MNILPILLAACGEEKDPVVEEKKVIIEPATTYGGMQTYDDYFDLPTESSGTASFYGSECDGSIELAKKYESSLDVRSLLVQFKEGCEAPLQDTSCGTSYFIQGKLGQQELPLVLGGNIWGERFAEASYYYAPSVTPGEAPAEKMCSRIDFYTDPDLTAPDKGLILMLDAEFCAPPITPGEAICSWSGDIYLTDGNCDCQSESCAVTDIGNIEIIRDDNIVVEDWLDWCPVE